MASNRNNYHKKGRQKVRKPDVSQTVRTTKKDRGRWFVPIIIIIVIAMVSSLFISMIGTSSSDFTLQGLKTAETAEPATFNEKNIILGQTFNRIDEEYYVVFTNEAGKAMLSDVTPVDKIVYYVDGTKFHSSSAFTDKAGKKLPTNPSEIAITDDIAVIHIVKGEATHFIQGKDNVIKKLN